ncbi:MAG: hypothetical protein WA805_25715 [Trebonia sp.]|uniref:hypothetical protein n=1 Tax=Trebonia sp. TaxID=2767075 RepID=UPI003CBC47E0
MTTLPARGADQALQMAPAGHSRDRRGSPIPTAGMIATRIMELRKRRGLMIALIVMNIGLPAVFLLIRLLAHAFAPYANPPAGGSMIFVVLAAGFLPTFGFIVATTAGCTAGSRDLTEGMFRHLVVTGRSRLALYLARIPAGLAIVVPLVAIGYTIVCAVCVFAAPAFIDDSNVNIPPGLSRAGFEHWARDHAEPIICSLGNGPVPGNVACPGPPPWSKSAVTPGQAAPAAVEALAIKIAKNDYPGYTAISRYPPNSLMIEAGLWIELQAAVVFIVGLGLASLMGQRTVPVILLIVFQIILTPILSAISIPHLQDLQRSLVGLAVAHLEPSGLPMAAALPGVTGGVGRPGAAQALLPESATQAVCVILAWLAFWTILGAWRMMTRDA